LNLPLQLQVPAAVPNTDFHGLRSTSVSPLPSLSDNIPNAEIISGQRDGNPLRLAWPECNIREALEEGWGRLRRLGQVQVELRDVTTFNRPCVLDSEGYVVRRTVEPVIHANLNHDMILQIQSETHQKALEIPGVWGVALPSSQALINAAS